MKVSFIIIHWNTPQELRALLSKLGNTYEIIVIDNASQEKLTWVKKEFPHITLLENSFNRGYAHACNQGITIAKGEWLLFLNPDVDIKQEEITKLISSAENSHLDAFSPQINNEAYAKPVPSFLSIMAEFTPLKYVLPLAVFKQKTLWGGCLCIKSDVIKKLQGWDERFFLWFEDSDLTYRLIHHGYSIGFLNSEIKHEGGTSFQHIDSQLKKDIFFHSLDIYARTHFNRVGQRIINLIKKRYTHRNILPVLNKGISLVIPNLKENLLKQFLKDNKDYVQQIDELIIVTSALDDSIWEYRKMYPQIRFIPLQKNKGFAHTVNIGLRTSTSPITGTINDDIIMSDNWLKECIAYSNNDTGSLNPLIYRPDGSIETAGISILPIGKAVAITSFPKDKTHDVTDATNGAAVLYVSEVLNKVGLYDEKFGSYLEDIDLSLRISRAGYKNIICYKARITHLAHATAKTTLGIKKQLFDLRNWIYVIFKNWSIKQYMQYGPAITIERCKNLSGLLKALFK